MTVIRLDRFSVINRLVEDDFHDIYELNNRIWTEHILKKGWIGYDTMTDEQLIEEYNGRAISSNRPIEEVGNTVSEEY